MIEPPPKTEVEFDQPILFRTTNLTVYEATLCTGSLWLRSADYYRNIEDRIRQDLSEGINESDLSVPLCFQAQNGPKITVSGNGSIGQIIVPHYILSLHGSSPSKGQVKLFGGCTFGIKNISKLSAEVLYRSSLTLQCTGYRYGQVSYQHTALALSHSQIGAAAMSIGGMPPVYLNPINTDVLRKQPTAPFVEQDEWRIVIFVTKYLNNDPNAPLQIQVDPSHFYPCAIA